MTRLEGILVIKRSVSVMLIKLVYLTFESLCFFFRRFYPAHEPDAAQDSTTGHPDFLIFLNFLNTDTV